MRFCVVECKGSKRPVLGIERDGGILPLDAPPSVRDALEQFGDAGLLDRGRSAAGAVRPLADFLSAREAWDRVLVGSFSPARLARFRRLTHGRVATGASPVEVIAFRFSPSARLADLLTGGRVAALQIPHRRGRVPVATPGLIRRAHRVGVRVDVWTVDDPAEMRLQTTGFPPRGGSSPPLEGASPCAPRSPS